MPCRVSQHCGPIMFNTLGLRIANSMDAHIIDSDISVQKIVEDTKKVYTNEISPEDVAKYYSNWAPEYETDFKITGLYLGPKYVADALGSIYRGNTETVRVLDIAAGTGILGERLHEVGFRNIDGLDPSTGMLDICRSKNIYSNFICDFITENPLDVQNDTYDCLAICGGMGAGHIPREALREMIRITKPGGYICNAMRQEFLDLADEYNNNKLDNTMLVLEEKNLWKKIERRILPNYFNRKPGIMFIHQVV